jgi:hypothetical protein
MYHIELFLHYITDQGASFVWWYWFYANTPAPSASHPVCPLFTESLCALLEGLVPQSFYWFAKVNCVDRIDMLFNDVMSPIHLVPTVGCPYISMVTFMYTEPDLYPFHYPWWALTDLWCVCVCVICYLNVFPVIWCHRICLRTINTHQNLSSSIQNW